MDVTKKNFKEVLPVVLEKLRKCKFVSFDLEMSGIFSTDKSKRNRKDDLPSQRYLKMIGPATTYSIVQFGLCIFTEENDGHYTASPYNFYLFPAFGPDISMSLSSIDFLKRNNLSFGDWINEGITFTDDEGEAWARRHFNLEDTTNSSSGTQARKKYVSLSRQSDIDMMDNSFSNLEKFLECPSDNVFEFEACNGFLRRYIYEQVELRYPDSLILKKDQRGALCAYKIDKQSAKEFEKKKREENIAKFQESVGFRRIYNELVKLKKPIVGHNLLFDIMFIQRWLDSPLPEDFSLFRRNLNTKFPCIYDTKYIDASGVLGIKHEETTLAQCMDRYKAMTLSLGADASSSQTNISDVSICDDCDFDPDSTSYHNAGYDAYCTGYVFSKQLGFFTSKILVNGESKEKSAFQKFRDACSNRTFMMQSLYHMNLDCGEESVPKYDGCIFRVTDFPREVQTQDVLLACSNALASKGLVGPEFETIVVWVDDFSFFVIVNESRLNENELRGVISSFLREKQWSVQTFEDYMISFTMSSDKVPTTSENSVTLLPTLQKRVSSVSTWMTDVFSSFSSQNASDDRGKKRARLE